MDNTQFVIEFWYWFALAAILASVEMLAPGVFFLWLGLAAFITGIATFMISDLSTAGQLTTFALFSMILIYIAIKFFKSKKLKTDQPHLNDRGAQYHGKTGTLEDAIVGGTGRARFGDTTWKVEGPDMPAGCIVKIVGSDGPVMKVEKIAEASPPPQP